MPVDPHFSERPDPQPEPVPQERWASPEVVVEDSAVAGPHGPVAVRLYRPARVTRALLWAHGGGFRGGDLDMPEAERVGGELARRAGALVVSVGYRLAGGGVRFPVPLDDVHAAWSWLGAADLPARVPVVLGGASAGAALALATALRGRDRGERTPDALLLAYPFAHFPVPALDAATATELDRSPVLMRFPPLVVEDMVANYVGRITDLPPHALPGGASLRDLPPTHLALSEYDDLRPSGELLARQLRETGVPVATHVARGMPHGHLNVPADLPAIEESLDFLATALRKATTR